MTFRVSREEFSFQSPTHLALVAKKDSAFDLKADIFVSWLINAVSKIDKCFTRFGSNRGSCFHPTIICKEASLPPKYSIRINKPGLQFTKNF